MNEYIQGLIKSNKNTIIAKYEAPKDRESTFQSEAQLEKEFIDILKKQGYEYVDITESKSLKNNLKIQLEKLNDVKFSDDDWERFYSSEIANKNNEMKEKIKQIQGEKGEDYKVSFAFESGEKRNLKLFDRINIYKNSLQVINQYEAQGVYKNRYDVSILVNGLPLVHIELKRRGVAIKEAFNQIERYKRESFSADDALFEFVQIFVISNGTNTKYYSNTIRNSIKRNFEFTSNWSDSQNENISDLMDFARTFFAKHTLLNILGFYCVFTEDESLMIMRPYQIAAAERIIQKIAISHNAKQYGNTQGGGYVWHTTGSGKTLTSFKTAQLATKMDFVSKVLFVVDRKDLDYQTMKEYDRFQKDSANSNANTSILTKQLSDPNAKIIITTIQKLDKFVNANKGHSVFDDEVVIIFDECHRSQFGSMHKSITRAFKKYYIFGFTGTPIFDENNDSGIVGNTTEHFFGDKLHTYTIIDAIKDGNVLKFNVCYNNTIQAKENIQDKQVRSIDTKSALLDERRIFEISKYILDKFAQYTKHDEAYTFNKLENIKDMAQAKRKGTFEVRNKTQLKGFNSLLACDGIEAAKKYYQCFKQLEHNLKIATIYSFNPNEDISESDGLDDENNESVDGLDQSSKDFLQSAINDYNKMFDTNYDISSQGFQSYYKDVSLRMKNKEVDILIVANMFLTGFDAPTLNTLWVDKNLKYHGLIQAFSRTNRVLNDVKSFGNVVCFRDLEENLNKSLALFGNSNSKSIAILKPYGHYLEKYKELIEKLTTKFELGKEIIKQEEQKEFISLFGEILKVRNILECFDDFVLDTSINDRDLQDYKSIYLDLYRKLRGGSEKEVEIINDDIVFEIELIRQTEITIDYILRLIGEYIRDKNKEKLKDIESSINSSISLRDKKDLILAFIERINSSSDVDNEFVDFVQERREKEFKELVKKHNLKEKEAYEFVKRAFEYGSMDFKGTQFPKILPNSGGFFSKDSSTSRVAIKQKVASALGVFFERFYNISCREF